MADPYADIASPSDPYASISTPTEKGAQQQPKAGTDWLRQLALQGRAAAEGVVGTLAMGPDLQEKYLFSPVRNAILNLAGKPSQPPMLVSDMLNKGLNAAGAYNPATPNEQLASAVTRGVTGGLTGAGIGGAASIPNAIRAAASGGTGAASAEIAKQKGYGPLVQTGAGLIGGLAPTAIEGAGRIGWNAIAPFTRSGQEGIAARILAANASNPDQAAQQLQNAQEVIPGSARTAGEASQDVGLLALEKGVRGRNTADFGQRISEQNAARQQALQNLAGTPADIAALQATRNAETGAMRTAALGQGGAVNTAPIIGQIDDVLSGPIGKRDIPSAALNWVKGKLEGETDPASLYAIRQDINDAMAGKLAGDAAKFRLARGQLLDVRSSLDDAIESAAPGFKAYLQRYSEMSKPIDQLKVMQEIQRRAQLSAVDVTTGQTFLGPAKFANALDSVVKKANVQLTPDQLEQLNAIKTDLQYGQAINSPLIKAPGSDTFQNLSIAQAIGMGGKKIPGLSAAVAKPLDWLYRVAKTDAGVNDALAQAMLDPKIAALMLSKANAQNASKMSAWLAPYMVGATIGTAQTEAQ
jgi:hypothetical protein